MAVSSRFAIAIAATRVAALLSVVCPLLTSCTDAVIRPVGTEAKVSTPAIQLDGLAQKIAKSPDRAVIIFVHGMSDQCPGYALDDRLGWFLPEIATAMGLEPAGSELPKIVVPDFENNDSKSTLVLQKRAFVRKGKRIDAIEITWSGLDRWLKDKQLGYDLSQRRTPKPIKDTKPGESVLDCIDAVGGDFKEARVPVNRFFKEGLLDRGLSDAVIYAGPYGTKIEREFADGLCRILGDDWSEAHPVSRCVWPSTPAPSDVRFMFVTHSLGSRIVYDTMIELRGTHLRPDNPVFSDAVVKAAKPSMDVLLEHTVGLYMMANQIPLLGLANARPSMSSSDPNPRLIAEDTGDTHEQNTAALEAQNAMLPDPIVSILAARRNLPSAVPGTLDIVAFSDPNDLLTFSLPDWYANVYGNLDVRITNVFVNNSTRWFGLVENPAAAHLGYYKPRREVWRVLACGASGGKPIPCL